MRFIQILCIALLVAAPATAAVTNITLYLDGGRVEREAVAVKGYLEIPLPRGMAAGSLRVRPLAGASLDRVEVVPARPDRKVDAEVTRLTERKDHLADRLKALEVREEIFRAAAKSQSGKAPRKSKNNREPVEEIRKGTEFAIAQLEGVYRARRKAEEALKGVESRLPRCGKQEASMAALPASGSMENRGGPLFRICSRNSKWTPSYSFRLNGLQGEVVMNALLPKIKMGTTISVVPAFLADGPTGQLVAASSDGPVPVASFRDGSRQGIRIRLFRSRQSPLPFERLGQEVATRRCRLLPAGCVSRNRQLPRNHTRGIERACFRQAVSCRESRWAGVLDICPPL